MRNITWTASSKGYEVTTRGDKRFSAFYAIMPDGRNLECHYQCDTKGFDPGGVNWRLGKGKPPLDPSKDMFKEYVDLWRIWAELHTDLINELLEKVAHHGDVLKDRFATTRVNQAHALSVILNEKLQQENENAR